MAPHADELCRINNGSQNFSSGHIDLVMENSRQLDKTNRSVNEMTRQSA